MQIWDLCDPSGSGHISRDSFYRSVALCALAQQGKSIDEKSLVLYGEAGIYNKATKTLISASSCGGQDFESSHVGVPVLRWSEEIGFLCLTNTFLGFL